VSDVEAIERATAAAVAPDHTEVLDGWVMTFADSEIRRGRSAAPLSHADAGKVDVLAAIEARYLAAGLIPLFRIADVEGLRPCAAELERRGYAPVIPTLVMSGGLADMKAVSEVVSEVSRAPDEGWLDVFTSEGFDAADGASRLAALSRSPDAIYASVKEAGRTLAVGVAALSGEWVSVHGMRTVQGHRGRGLARRVLAALATEAIRLNRRRVFLQVEADNTSAHRLYAAAGFSPAWRYRYWQAPA
jgi:GNAT superfamily N-acetyltransferase